MLMVVVAGYFQLLVNNLVMSTQEKKFQVNFNEIQINEDGTLKLPSPTFPDTLSDISYDVRYVNTPPIPNDNTYCRSKHVLTLKIIRNNGNYADILIQTKGYSVYQLAHIIMHLKNGYPFDQTIGINTKIAKSSEPIQYFAKKLVELFPELKGDYKGTPLSNLLIEMLFDFKKTGDGNQMCNAIGGINKT